MASRCSFRYWTLISGLDAGASAVSRLALTPHTGKEEGLGSSDVPSVPCPRSFHSFSNPSHHTPSQHLTYHLLSHLLSTGRNSAKAWARGWKDRRRVSWWVWWSPREIGVQWGLSHRPSYIWGPHHRERIVTSAQASWQMPHPHQHTLWCSAQSQADKGGVDLSSRGQEGEGAVAMCQVWCGGTGDQKAKKGPFGTACVCVSHSVVSNFFWTHGL